MKLAIIGNLDKPGLREAVQLLLEKISPSKMDYVIDAKIVRLLAGGGMVVGPSHTCEGAGCLNNADVLVAFGGDGTILSAARMVGAGGTPILGVNLGKLGFLAELAPDDMAGAIDDILDGKFIIEERLVLKATLPSQPDKVFFAVNDIVVDKSRSPRLIDLVTQIDGAFAVTYRGDGLIISTPTGSTGYALSSGGPIVIPTSHVIGITPISPHSLNGRPLIIPDASVVRVVVRTDVAEILLSSDGQAEAFLKPPVEVLVQKADYTLKLVKRVDRSYFDVLRAKLLWGQDARSS